MVHTTKKRKSFWANTVEIIGLLLLVFLIRTFGFGLYQVPSGSMETTLLVGERFFADKLSYLFREPRRGEVISFNEPPVSYHYSGNTLINLFQRYVWGPSNWTKRVIGVPGDEVRGAIEDGKPVVYLNGKKLDEPYLNKYPLIHLWRTATFSDDWY
jgi:signal peptidase I